MERIQFHVFCKYLNIDELICALRINKTIMKQICNSASPEVEIEEVADGLLLMRIFPRVQLVLNLIWDRIITDIKLSYLINLTKLELSSDNLITDNGLKNLNKLRSLSLNGNHDITPKGITHLVGLRELDIRNNDKIDDSCLSFFPDLLRLKVNSTMVTDMGFRNLSFLQYLSISRTVITGTCFASTPDLRELRIVRNEFISDSVMIHLTKLEILAIADCKKVTNNGIHFLVNLKEFWFDESDGYNDATVEPLLKLKLVRVYPCNPIKDNSGTLAKRGLIIIDENEPW